MKDGVDIPANIEVSGNPRPYFPADEFEEMMDILRHEPMQNKAKSIEKEQFMIDK